MKLYLNILFMSAFLLTLQACKDTKDIEADLHKADVYMAEHPELALEALESICVEQLSTRKLQAKYALLYSMALDKNYIDVTNDSIIAPAVEFYRNHGTADDKLKANYYWGRIAMNTGEYEDAISRFITAEQYAEKAYDKVAVGRLYKAQTSVYQYCYDTDAMIEAADKTANLYLALGDTAKYIASLFDMTAGYLNNVDTTNARNTLAIVKEYLPTMSEWQKSQYFANQLILNGHTSPSRLSELLSEYEKEILNRQFVQWLAVAKAYYICEDYDRAIDAINNYDYYGGLHNDTYFWISGLIHEALEDSPQAMYCYKNYIEQTDDKLGYLLEADIRFIKERFKKELTIKSRNFVIILFFLCIIILLLAVIIIVRENLRRNELNRIEIENTLELLNNAQTEINHLNMLKSQKGFDKDTMKILEERFDIVNKYILETLSESVEKTAASNLREMTEKTDEFLNSTRLAFKAFHPKFIQYLEQHLSSRETGYCCLLCLGLNIKEVNGFMNLKSYNFSYGIRKKLGLTESLNITSFLRAKFKELKQ